MPGTDRFAVGTPCWVDLWTSDVEGSRAFYAQLFGWEAMEPSEEFGGYFMFHRNGQPIAGGMGDMGPDMPANDTWKIYLSTDDIAGVAAALEASGAEMVAPPMTVADLGQNMVFVDPTGAHLGAWQPDTFAGFAAVDEHGAPGWFELFTRDFAGALEFYRSVFHWKTELEGDTDEFRYATLRDAEIRRPAGRGDGRLGVPARWRAGPLVGVLAGRRRRRHGRPGDGAGRRRGGRADGHALWTDGDSHRPIGRHVQTSHPAVVVPAAGQTPGHSRPRRRGATIRRATLEGEHTDSRTRGESWPSPPSIPPPARPNGPSRRSPTRRSNASWTGRPPPSAPTGPPPSPSVVPGWCGPPGSSRTRSTRSPP